MIRFTPTSPGVSRCRKACRSDLGVMLPASWLGLKGLPVFPAAQAPLAENYSERLPLLRSDRTPAGGSGHGRRTAGKGDPRRGCPEPVGQQEPRLLRAGAPVNATLEAWCRSHGTKQTPLAGVVRESALGPSRVAVILRSLSRDGREQAEDNEGRGNKGLHGSSPKVHLVFCLGE
jgi:hypothetical protein